MKQTMKRSNNLKARRGLSLVEVIMSFVLISLMAVIIGGVFTSSYVLSAQLEKLPNAYQAAQDLVERKISSLQDLIKEKYSLQNEYINTPDDELTDNVKTRMAAVETELAGEHRVTVTLFGKSVDIYDFKEEYTSEEDGDITLYGGVANFVPLDRPVPIIDSLEINISGCTVANDAYQAFGSSARTAVEYNEKNYAYYYCTLYQWYVCTADYSTATNIQQSYDDDIDGSLIAKFPESFTLLPGETGVSLKISEEYAGRFILCAATPLSVEGKRGRTVYSNFLYISALPELSSGSYRMVIDPSLTYNDAATSGWLSVNTIDSRLPNTVYMDYQSEVPYLILEGSDTDRVAAEDEEESENTLHYTRYLRFTYSSAMVTRNLADASGTKVYAVARDLWSAGGNFLFSGTGSAGFSTNTYLTTGQTQSGWRILAADLPVSGGLTVGYGNVDLAELIVVENPSAEDDLAIKSYLSVKYHIDETF